MRPVLPCIAIQEYNLDLYDLWRLKIVLSDTGVMA